MCCHALSLLGTVALKRVFATPQDAEAAFYDALERLDLDAMMEVWSEDDEIVCIHPGQPRLSGYDAVRAAWQRIFQGGQRLKVRLTNGYRCKAAWWPYTVCMNT